jgi:hypothetical protein
MGLDCSEGGSRTGAGIEAGIGAGAGAGGGAWNVGVGTVLTGAGVNEACVEDNISPLSRLTSSGEAVFPEKYSPADNVGSEAGAGGKISDWKESD